MKAPAPLAVAFREVRHFRPDDCLHCETIAVRGRQYEWTIPTHRHEGLHQFQLIERGNAQVTLDGVAYDVAAPAALMVAPGTVHGFVYAPDVEGHQVTVPSALLHKAFAGAPALAARLPHSLLLQGEALAAEFAEALDLFLHLEREFQLARPGRTEALQSQVQLLALWFLRGAGEPRADEHRQAVRDTLVQRYRALLELHFRQHRPVSFYAGALHVTADHLSRACRAVAGLSALDLLHERVLLEARRLLAYTQVTVADVAHQLGFDDPAYFSRFFARRAGQAPSAYRLAVREGLAVQPGAPLD